MIAMVLKSIFSFFQWLAMAYFTADERLRQLLASSQLQMESVQQTCRQQAAELVHQRLENELLGNQLRSQVDIEKALEERDKKQQEERVKEKEELYKNFQQQNR